MSENDHAAAIRAHLRSIRDALNEGQRVNRKHIMTIRDHADALAAERDHWRISAENGHRRLAEATAREPDRVVYEWVYDWGSGATTTVTTTDPDHDVYDGWDSNNQRRAYLQRNIQRVVVRTLHTYVVDERVIDPGDLDEPEATS